MIFHVFVVPVFLAFLRMCWARDRIRGVRPITNCLTVPFIAPPPRHLQGGQQVRHFHHQESERDTSNPFAMSECHGNYGGREWTLFLRNGRRVVIAPQIFSQVPIIPRPLSLLTVFTRARAIFARPSLLRTSEVIWPSPCPSVMNG